MPEKLDLLNLAYEMAPKLAAGDKVALPPLDPWLKAVLLAVEQQMNGALAEMADEHSRKLDTIRDEYRKLRHLIETKGQDE